MADIDYTQKIRNFQHITDTYNEDEAFTYLEKFDWDENVNFFIFYLYYSFYYNCFRKLQIVS
jgi:hypothetical protein